MSFDRKTNTITVGEHEGFVVDSGKMSIAKLRDDASEFNGQLANDWRVTEDCLGCAGRELGQEDLEKDGKSWKAYYAIGLAPFLVLQDIFDHYSRKYKEEGYVLEEDKPPAGVIAVFDRLMASDEEIRFKQQSDSAKKALKLEAKLKEIVTSNKAPFLVKKAKSKSRTFSSWLTGGVVAMIIFGAIVLLL